MAELERELRAAGRRLEWPATPELAERVRPRLETPPERTFRGRRKLVLALAVLAVAIAAAFAVPAARTAILRWLGLTHVRVTRVSSLPPTRRLTTGDLGRKTTVAAAERRLGFAILEPRERPDAVYLLSRPGSKRLTLVYGSVRRPRLLLSEFRGTGTTTYIQKFVEPGTKVERVRIGDAPGIWIGGPHAVLYAAPGTGGVLYSDDPILAGSTLVWERPGGLTLRLEGTLTKAGAERLAGSLREPPGKGTSAGR